MGSASQFTPRARFAQNPAADPSPAGRVPPMTSPRDLQATLREHGSGLHQLACALVGRADADDAVQEVWLEALRAPPPREGPLGGWLRTVLLHVAWRTRRGERRRRARQREVVQGSRNSSCSSAAKTSNATCASCGAS